MWQADGRPWKEGGRSHAASGSGRGQGSSSRWNSQIRSRVNRKPRCAAVAATPARIRSCVRGRRLYGIATRLPHMGHPRNRQCQSTRDASSKP